MACIITYENKQYTQKEFEQYLKEHFVEFVDTFLGSKQDIEGFKEFIKNKNFIYSIEESSKKSNNKENLSELFFDGKEQSDSLTILNKIKQLGGYWGDLARLLEMNNKRNIPIYLEYIPDVIIKGKKYKAMGYYDPNDDEIVISLDNTKESFIPRILEEIIHGFVYHKLEKNPNFEFNEIYLYAKSQIEKLGLGEKYEYQINDIHEFFAALFKDLELINTLNNIPPLEIKEAKNFWIELWHKILKLLGFNKTKHRNLYNQAFSLATKILEYPPNSEEYKNVVEWMKDRRDIDRKYSIENGEGTDADPSMFNDNLDEELSSFMNLLNDDKSFEREKAKPAQNEDEINEIFKMLETPQANINYEDEYFKANRQINFKLQEVFFRRNLKKLENEYLSAPEGPQKDILRNKFFELEKKYENATLFGNDYELFKELGEYFIDKLDNDVKDMLSGSIPVTSERITYLLDVINTFKDFADFSSRLLTIHRNSFPLINQFKIDQVNQFSYSKKGKITQKDIDYGNGQDEDIDSIAKNTGVLVNLENWIAKTIGTKIKFAWNRITRKNSSLENRLERLINGLKSWGDKNNMTLQEVYDLFIVEKYDTLAKISPGEKNYNLIISNEELREFYNFWTDLISKANDISPVKFFEDFMPNIHHKTLMDNLKELSPIVKKDKNIIYKDEDTFLDAVGIKFLNKIPSDKKSRDLGHVLHIFGRWLNEYEEMSNLLPELRVLEHSFLYTYNPDNPDSIEKRKLKSSSDPSKLINADESNLYEMIKTTIDMQVKGKMKLHQFEKKIPFLNDKDKDVYINFADLLDNIIRWNSLLRIGLSPITAATNALFGEISNIIESIGGRYFTSKELHQATQIFFSQINYNPFTEKENFFHEIMFELNFLQELDDYENLTETKIGKKLSKEKFMNFMYSLQKKGELFLQSRTGLAILIHDGYITPDGKPTDKWRNMSNEEKDFLTEKIQGINGYIHGRYSQREAMIINQHVLWRMISQFKKWIPAAYERRFGKYKYVDRIGSDFEGTYLTFGRKVLTETLRGNIFSAIENMIFPLINGKKMIESGKLTELEVYNLRRMSIEILSVIGIFLMYSLAFGGDDDKEKRKKAYVKTMLLILNRISGDISFWYDPNEMSRILTNSAPSTRLMNDLIFLLNPWHWRYIFGVGDAEFERGSRKGENKFASKLMGVIPGVKSYSDIKRITSPYLLEELNSTNTLDKMMNFEDS